MKWHQLWTARFGDEFKTDTLAVWDEELHHEVKNLQHEEILEAVRDIAEDKRIGRIKYKPTLNHLVSAIVRLRFENRNGGSGPANQTKREDRINHLRATIRRCMEDGNPIGAWTAICHHSPSDEIPDAEMWAIKALGFERPTFEQMGLKPLTQVMRELRHGDGLRNVTADIRTRTAAPKPQYASR